VPLITFADDHGVRGEWPAAKVYMITALTEEDEP
jgi:hypothetical protein